MKAPRVKSRLTMERGYVLITVAASLLMLMGIAAYVVDLSAIRLDRAADQRITDAAASAGALATFETDAVEGCQDALDYVAINTAGIGTLDDSGCTATFSTSCLPGTARELFISTDRWQITVVNPVPDGHALMNPGQIGASGYGAAGDDGNACDRFGVQMTATHTSNFAQAIGSDQGSTTVHSVALARLPPPDGVPINVLVLDRHGCGTVKVSGNGGIIVDAIYNPDENILEPGTLAADSDAANCAADSPDTGVIVVEGNNAVMRADGPEGCAEQTGTAPFAGLTKGLGCGLIQTVAPGTPGCNPPACSGSGSGPNNPIPEPTALAEPLTRQPIDHRYNCRADYTTVPISVGWAASALTGEQAIDGCFGPGSNYIHQLIAGVGPSGSPLSFGPWQQWSPTYECDIPSGATPINESGNWWINCPSFNVRADVTINGNVVFDGNVNITSSDGHLVINNAGSGETFTFAFLRNGVMTKDGQAGVTFNETTVYASRTSRVQMAGGGGSLIWIAPDDETKPLDDLALWSDSEITAANHFWAGQATFNMEGVFFVPIVTVEYAGQGSQIQTSAQFIADRLHARGQGELTVAPVFGRAVGLRPPPYTILLR